MSGQLHAPAALSPGKSPRYPFYRRLGDALVLAMLKPGFSYQEDSYFKEYNPAMYLRARNA
jgi:hypothetical protein